jgi:signal peptidase I
LIFLGATNEDPRRLSIEMLDAAVELMGRAGRGGTFPVSGTSMEPTLRAGQTLAVEFTPETLRCGDVLLFRQVDALVVHRLLGSARDGAGRIYYRTRGDGQPALDPPVAPERVVGRVVAVLDDAGWRTLRSFPARLFGRCVAWHDLVWAVSAVLAGRGDGALRRLGLSGGLRTATVVLDRGLLKSVHRLCFRGVHRLIESPNELGP